MLKETLSQTDVINYPLFALILFVAVFAFVVVRVLMSGRKDGRMEAMSRLPLDDDDAAPAFPNQPASPKTKRRSN
jgi:cbb3-type cytochrome oxidase subunit 3